MSFSHVPNQTLHSNETIQKFNIKIRIINHRKIKAHMCFFYYKVNISETMQIYEIFFFSNKTLLKWYYKKKYEYKRNQFIYSVNVFEKV